MLFYTFLPKLFNMSLTASVAIVLVILFRLLLKKAPKVISYGLWSVVLFRLLCPVSIGSVFSLYNLLDAPAEGSGALTSVIEYVPSDIVHAEDPSVVLPVPGISNAINAALPQGQERADPLEVPVAIATYVWMTGVLVMAVYSIVSYIRLRRKLSAVIPLRHNIYIADDIKSPFVVGLFCPKIYLPCNLREQEQEYIILHEQHHIKRLDHIVKALAFLALAIHWFNPLVWAAFTLAGKDMEMSCDEAVIRRVGGDVRADYAASLLTLATGRRSIAGTPLAFGEGDTKGRIHNLANWRKPAVWVVAIAVIGCAIAAIGVLTNPVADIKLGDIGSVTVENIRVSDEAADALVTLIHSHHRTPFTVGLDDPTNALSRAIQLNCADGGFYLLLYQYHSGFSFDPRHAGEDDYRSILTFFEAGEGGKKAWKMEYDFDAKLKAWLSEYAPQSFGWHQDFSGVLHLGLNAEIIGIDKDRNILYVKDIDKSAVVFGDRSAVDCSYAISRSNLLYVNYGDANDVRAIEFSAFEVGDAIIIGMYDSEKQDAFNGSAVAEQVQLSTQRLSSTTTPAGDYETAPSVQEVRLLSENYDFDHDGVPEITELVTHFDDALQYTWFELRVKKADGTLLWSDEAHTAHSGYNSLFACTLDGKDYLLQYNPTMYQGECAYTYRLFAFDPQGNRSSHREGNVRFDINWGSWLHSKFDAVKLADFMDEVNGLLANSRLLLNTDTALADIDPESPQDIPWWLKDPSLCSGYAYDEDKTLRDNLLELENVTDS